MLPGTKCTRKTVSFMQKRLVLAALNRVNGATAIPNSAIRCGELSCMVSLPHLLLIQNWFEEFREKNDR
jgi:hypothetical protein